MPPIRHRDHTDGLEVKIRLLQEALATGRRDLALSLAESIKDTIQFERRREAGPGGLHSGPDHGMSVDALPRPWAQWARGWSGVKPIDLFETVGSRPRVCPCSTIGRSCFSCSGSLKSRPPFGDVSSELFV